MAFTTSGQETEWALFLQPWRPHGHNHAKAANTFSQSHGYTRAAKYRQCVTSTNYTAW